MLQMPGDWTREEDIHLLGAQGTVVLQVRLLETPSQRMHCREPEMLALRGVRGTVGTQDGGRAACGPLREETRGSSRGSVDASGNKVGSSPQGTPDSTPASKEAGAEKAVEAITLED